MRQQRIPGTEVLEKGGVKLVVDRSFPNDKQLKECRPDLVAYFASRKGILIFEVACCRDTLVAQHEREKGCKYAEFASDLATQHPGCTVRVATVVVGTFSQFISLFVSLSLCLSFSLYT